MNSFDKEDIYELTIRIYYPGVSISSGSSGNYVESKFTIYASDIINNFASIYDNFNNIDDSGSQLNAYTIFNDLDRVVKTSVFDYTNFMYNNKIEYYSKVDNKEQVINNINDLKTADYDDQIFQDYFAKLYSNNEYDYTSKHLYIGGKSEYKINKDLNSIISLPLNQYEVVGRMWRSCKYLDGLSISLNDSNNNTFNINIDEDGEATFNIASEYDIYADTIDSFNKQAAINSISMMDVNDSPVTFQDNNFYIKKALVWHKSASSPGRTRLGPAEAITSKNIRVKFNVVGSEYELTFFYVNAEGENETFVLNTGRLNQSEASFTRMFKAFDNLWREIDEPRQNGNSDAAFAITQKAYAPYIFITVNDNNFNLLTKSLTFNVIKATVNIVIDDYDYTYNGLEFDDYENIEIDLSEIYEELTYGIDYELNVDDIAVDVNSYKLNLNIINQNILNNYDINITDAYLNIKPKEIEITIENDELIYNNEVQIPNYIIAEEVYLTYELYQNNIKIDEAKEIGEYQIKFILNDKNYKLINDTFTFKIIDMEVVK